MGADMSLPNFNALLMQGYETGREMKRQDAERNALATIAASPNDQKAFGSLLQVNPKLALDYRQAQNQTVQQQTQQQQQLSDQQRKMLEQGQKAVGQAALIIARLPKEQQAQAWDQQIDMLVSQGWDGLSQYRGRYSPASLQNVIAQSGLANEYLQGQQPRYMAPQPGAPLVNVADPVALQEYNRSVLSGGTKGGTPDLPPGFVVDGGPTPAASGNFPGR